nr:MAG TPA: PgaD-like protein [Crassvirales sp.]
MGGRNIFITLYGIPIAIAIIGLLIYNFYTIKDNGYKEDAIIEKVNDSIKVEVKQLDSIKNAKVIEVKTLDNDSTIKLFYKLIK